MAVDSEVAVALPRMSRSLRILSALAALVPLVAVLGLPVTTLGTFLLLVLAVVMVAFGRVDLRPRRWALAIGTAVLAVAIVMILPDPAIEEGHNVFVPAEGTLPVFEKELPPAVLRVMTAEFDRTYFIETEGLRGSPEWWKNDIFKAPGYFAKQTYAPSADALWQRPKYSRVVDGIGFASQDEARIGAINTLAHNHELPARIDRREIPFFVMVEMNSRLTGGKVCWRGQILWEGPGGDFSTLNSEEERCRQIAAQDVGRKVFALSIARDRPLEFQVSPPLGLQMSLWAQGITRVVAFAAIMALLISIDALHRLLLPVGAVVATLLTITVMRPGFLTSFWTHDAGNDGLTHESLGREIAAAISDGRWSDALQGGEQVFYFMPGLRYFRAIEDFLFGDTSFGMVLAAIFLPIFLFAFMRSLLPLRWCVALIVAFLFTPIFERFGFADFNYLRELTKGFAEPVGYAAFLGGLALVAPHVAVAGREGPRSDGVPAAWIGLAFAVSVAMRPNLAIAAAIVVCATGLWLLIGRRAAEAAILAMGFASLLLVTSHNWYFGDVFVPITSSAFHPANMGMPPAVYLDALGELLNLELAGANLDRVLGHLGAWNGWSDFYRVVAVLVVVWVALRRRTPAALRTLAVVALSMQAVLLFYIPKGRYTYLAWLLVFLIVMVTVRDVFLPWMRRNHPRVLEATGRLPMVRHISRAIGSPRWSLAHDLSRISPYMGLLDGFRTELRPLVSPLNEVIERLPRGCRLYDIGCGAGGLLHLALLRRDAAFAAGYDVSARAIRAARKLPWRDAVLKVSRRDPADGIPDLGDTDVVTMVDVLHHVPPKEQDVFVAQVADRMRSGARLVVADIDAGRPVGRWLNQLHDLIVSGDWVHPRRAGETERMFSAAGLRIIETHAYRSLWYPHYLLVAEKSAIPDNSAGTK